MGLMDLFKTIPSITANEVREVISTRKPDEYCLVDVRQPGEYEQGHLPGARLVPLGELAARKSELDPKKYTIVYCRSGNRSRSAYSILAASGFEYVINMDGGIMAYRGVMASGGPDAGSFCFPAAMGSRELAAMGWHIETGLQAFLESLKPTLGYALLARAEGSSRDRQARLAEFVGQKEAVSIIAMPPEPTMPGCVKVSAALNWAKGKPGKDIIELLMSLTANAYDIYLKMGRMSQSEDARKLFSMLADESLSELSALGSDMDKAL